MTDNRPYHVQEFWRLLGKAAWANKPTTPKKYRAQKALHEHVLALTDEQVEDFGDYDQLVRRWQQATVIYKDDGKPWYIRPASVDF